MCFLKEQFHGWVLHVPMGGLFFRWGDGFIFKWGVYPMGSALVLIGGFSKKIVGSGGGHPLCPPFNYGKPCTYPCWKEAGGITYYHPAPAQSIHLLTILDRYIQCMSISCSKCPFRDHWQTTFVMFNRFCLL